jgi:7-cyano-7-deazaguanine synthase
MSGNVIFKEKAKVLILFSGGADSTLLVELAKRMTKEVFCLLIDYNQLHKQELEFAKEYCVKNDIPFKVAKVELTADSGLTGTGEKGRYQGVSQWYVPARNTIFLSLAASEAESRGIEEIWYGADWSDRENNFPDCTQEYIYRINDLLKFAVSSPVKVYAPTLGLTKDMVKNLLESFGITKDQYFSGYGDLER